MSILAILVGWFVWNRTEGFIDTEVFHVNGGSNAYIFPKDTLASVCSKYGARGATYSELEAARLDSADWCSTGWIADRNEAYYPIKTNRTGCGTPGINVYTPENAGVNCYGAKPASSKFTGETVLPFQYKATGPQVWNDPTPTTYTPLPLPDRYFETYQKTDGVLLPTVTSCTQPSFTSLEEALRACDTCKAGCDGVTDFYGMYELRKGVASASGNSSYVKRTPPNYNYFLQPS